ncbi:MAG: PHB depolymerase family esterase [Myxococcota bacterium]
MRALALVALVVCAAPTVAHAQATLVEVEDFGSNPGWLRMFRYAPAEQPTQAPLVVALHGCDQTAADLATGTGWNDLADRLGFYVVYPEQSLVNNWYGCFNWFSSAFYERDQGEAASIMAMVEEMQRQFSVDPERIFIMGLSAGGFMAASLLAGYPDVFAGGAIMEGGPAGCAETYMDSSACMSGVDLTPAEWADVARALYTEGPGPYPVVSLFHGSADDAVSDVNLRESMEQWTAVHGVDTVAEQDDVVNGHPHHVYRDGAGRAVVETYHLQGLGHAVSVDPGPGPEQGGSVAEASYVQDGDLWAPYHAARFWGLVPEDNPADGGVPSDGGLADGGATPDAAHADDVDDAGVADAGGPVTEADAGSAARDASVDHADAAEPVVVDGGTSSDRVDAGAAEDAGAAMAVDAAVATDETVENPSRCACAALQHDAFAAPGVLVLLAFLRVRRRR